jgi:hypothetical protein
MPIPATFFTTATSWPSSRRERRLRGFSMKKFRFQTEPIDIAAVYSEVGQRVDGAVVSFIGCPRMKSNDREVTHLEYEIYERWPKVSWAR